MRRSKELRGGPRVLTVYFSVSTRAVIGQFRARPAKIGYVAKLLCDFSPSESFNSLNGVLKRANDLKRFQINSFCFRDEKEI